MTFHRKAGFFIWVRHKWDIVKEVLGLSTASTMFSPGTLRSLEDDGEDDAFE